MTTQEAIARANDSTHQDANRPIVRQWLAGASAREIMEFIYGLWVGWNERHLPAARAALDVRLAEDAAKQTETLTNQVATLAGIAEAQRVLAVKLDRQTNKLIRLTWALVFLTVALLVHERFPKHSTAHPEGPQPGSTNAVSSGPSTNQAR